MSKFYYMGAEYGGASRVGTVTLLSSGWIAGTGESTQAVSLGLTIDSNTKVDLQPDSTVINQMVSDGTYALYAVNNNGVVTVHAVGSAPSVDLTVQFTA